MPYLTIRKFKRADLLDAFTLIFKSANDLRVKNGRKPWEGGITDVPPFNLHLFDTDSKGAFGAYYGGKLVGFASALLRGRQWYLAYLFVDPDFQLKGVGRRLLDRAWAYGAGRAGSYALCTFPYNETALALYSSYGMMPTMPIFEMYVRPERNAAIHPARLKWEVDNSPRAQARINRLEKEIRGYARPVDIKFFGSESNHKIYQFFDGVRWAGYAVVAHNRIIAPAGAVAPRYLPEIITHAHNRCIESGAELVRIWAPGPNAALYERLIKLGFRIGELTVFLSTRPYGDFYRYCPAHLAMF
jgi:ribosomal protein S18 acetylase RimI-like enzyme